MSHDQSALQQAILESAPYSIISTTVDGLITTFNTTAERWLGYRADEVIGKVSPAIIHDRHEIEQRARALTQELGVQIEPGFETFVAKVRRGQVEEREWTYIRKDGSRFPVLLSMTTLQDEQGNITGFLGIGTDISERRRAEADVERIFNLSPDMLCIAGLDGYFKKINPAFERILGYSKAELLAQPFINFVHPDDRPATRAEVEKLSTGQSTMQFENRYCCRDGTYKWLAWNAFPIPEENLLYSVARNMTEAKQAEQERLQLLAREQTARTDAEVARQQITSILESITDAFFAVDHNWHFTYVNRQAEPLLQKRKAELLGKDIWDEFPEAIDSIFYQEYHRAVNDQISVEFEAFYPPFDTWFEVHAYPSQTGLSVYFQDITQRKRAETALLQKTQALEIFSTHLKHLHRLNTTAYEGFNALFADYLETGCQMLGMPTGIISQVRQDSYTIQSVQSNLSSLEAGQVFDLRNTYCAAVIQEQKTITYTDVSALPEMTHHPVYQTMQLKSYIGTPIFVNGDIFGTLNFSSTQAKEIDFEPHERELVELMAQSIGRFIAAHQTETERQQAVDELQQQNRRSQLFASITLKIRQSLHLDEILKTTVTEIQTLLEADRVLLFDLDLDGHGTVVEEAVVPGWPVLYGQNIDDPCFREEYLERYQQGRVSAITDITTGDIHPCHVELLAQFGVRSNLVVPILIQNHLWGLLIVHQCSQPRQWTDLETDLLKHLADQVGIALAQSELVVSLRESEARFRTMADSAPVLIWLSGTNQQFTFFNHQWLTFTGRSLDQELGDGWTESIHPDDVSQCLNDYVTAFNARRRFQAEYRLRRADGEYRWFLGTGVPRFTPDGGFAGYIGTCTDISDRREIEQMKDEFVSLVSHELRTPLTSIRGAMGLLAGGVLRDRPEKGLRMLKIAVKNTDRLIRLINDILDIERIESGKVVMNCRSCDVADLITQSVEEVRTLTEKAHITLSVSSLSATVWADPDRIIQTLTNLISNAIKFSTPGNTIWLTATVQSPGSESESQTRTQIDSSQVLFQVRDQGRGIPSDKIQSIFGRFQQVDASDSRRRGGTGLGLAICRSIVLHHGGEIWAESTFGEGSSFFFTLPLLQNQHTINPDTSDHPLVLVCDDDPAVRTVVQAILEESGYRVETVASGSEAIRQGDRHQPDVILLNLMMPEMDGWEALAALKTQPRTRNIPVVILSGLLPDEREANRYPPFSDWIVKPPQEQQLLDALKHALAPSDQSIKVLIVEDDLDLAQVLMTIFEQHGVEAYHSQNGQDAIQVSQQVLPDLLVLDLVLPDLDGFAVVNWLRLHNRLRQVPLVVYTAKDLTAEEREQLQLGQTLYLTKGRIAPEHFEERIVNLLDRIIRERHDTVT